MILNSKKVKNIIKYMKNINSMSDGDLCVYIKESKNKVQFVASNKYSSMNLGIVVESDSTDKMIWLYKDLEKILNIKADCDIDISKGDIVYGGNTIINSVQVNDIDAVIEQCISRFKKVSVIGKEYLSFNLSSEDIKKLKELKKFCLKDNSRPILEGVNILNGEAYSLDGFRCSMTCLSDKTDKNIVINKNTIDALATVSSDFEVKYANNKIKCQSTKDDVVIIFTTNTIEGSFVRRDEHFCKKDMQKCELEGDKLYEYISSVIKSSKNKKEEKVYLKFSSCDEIGTGKLEVVNKGRDQKISLNYIGDKIDLLIGFNPYYLKDALYKCNNVDVYIKDRVSHMIIASEQNEMQNVVLPIRMAK